MKKIMKIILFLFIIFCVFGCICGIVDKNRISNNKEPIFCINQSGGSVILYIGPGYIINGAWDDNPGGLKYSEIHTWIWGIIQSIQSK